MAHRGDEHIDNTISGGVFFSAVIQGRDITVVLPPQVTPAMAGLPAVSAAFTGRGQDLDALLRVLAPHHKEGAAENGTAADAAAGVVGLVVVTAVGGMGGIGKTELALQAAHAALGRGWFAGGVLFVDMFGYDSKRRLTAAQAAAGFLRALGIPGEHIPADARDLERLLHSVLDAYATQGRPVLMVIDNVSDQAQAAPLLPAHPACRAIVTSRHTLGRLGARLIDLDTLDNDQVVELLRRAIEVARPGDQRVTDHLGDVRLVAEACGGLPLAVRIAAALLADNPAKPLAAMASDLHDQAGRLAEFSYGGDALTTAFDLSYQQLPAGQARLFRLLSASPGPDIDTTAAAALAGLPEAEARRELEALARAHLIQPGSTYGRWRMHDLIRLHSAHHGDTHADADQRPEALTRLLEYYLATARAANAHLARTYADPATLGFPLDEVVQALLYAEEAITACQHAVQIFRDTGDRHREGRAVDNLGVALLEVQRFEEAITAGQDAVQIFRDVGDQQGEGQALNNLGLALRQAGRFGEAITAGQDAVQIYRDTGDHHGEAIALNNLQETKQAQDGIPGTSELSPRSTENAE